jgi:S-adenosyl-L-methionine hydrolase (adenosine-forming)
MAIITITSDTGNNDFVVGALKGLIYQKNEQAKIVDISHQIGRQNIAQAAYLAGSAIFYYPKNSLHIIMVGLFNKAKAQNILAYYNNQYIICANNGLLSLLLKQQKPNWVVSLPHFANIENATLMFAAQCAYALEQINKNNTQQLGAPIEELVEKIYLPPSSGDNWIEAPILHIDIFENVIVNITKEFFYKKVGDKPFNIVMRNVSEIKKISAHYGEVSAGEPVAIFNMAGYLEIGVNQGNASGLFGLQAFNDKIKNSAYARSRLNYQTIRIEIETD